MEIKLAPIYINVVIGKTLGELTDQWSSYSGTLGRMGSLRINKTKYIPLSSIKINVQISVADIELLSPIGKWRECKEYENPNKWRVCK